MGGWGELLLYAVGLGLFLVRHLGIVFGIILGLELELHLLARVGLIYCGFIGMVGRAGTGWAGLGWWVRDGNARILEYTRGRDRDMFSFMVSTRQGEIVVPASGVSSWMVLPP